VVAQLAALTRPEVDGVRWTKPEQWHVTLRFIGTADIAEALAAFGEIGARPAQAVMGPVVQRFGRGAAAIPVDGLDRLAAAVVDATAGVGQPPDRRGFVGHLTIARCKTGLPSQALGSDFTAEFGVEEIHLIRSHLDHVGPTYEILSTRDLG